MMPAAKMMDPVMGIDVHIVQPPGPVPPLPVPHPFVGMLFDPMELAPIVGASVFVNGMPKATAGSEGKAVPPHIPIGGVFIPPPPGNECEMFMGSATVLFEGEPASYTALPALSCQTVGMPAPFRLKKKPKPILKLPTSVVMPIPAGPPVLIGGPPTISMSVIGMKIAMGALGKAAKKVRKMLKKSKKAKAISKKIHKKAQKAMDKLGIPKNSAIRNKVHKGICTVTGHPVDVATGKVFTDNVDFVLGGAIPFRWERTWFSTSVYSGPLGHGWHHAYDLGLVEDGGAVAIRSADGRALAFPRLAIGESFYLRSEKLTLLRDEAGYFLRTRERLDYRFAGRPSARGEHPLLSVSDAPGRSLRFAYDAQGRLEAVRDTADRLIRFRTDWAGRILEIRVPDPALVGQDIPIVTYRYDDAGDMAESYDAHNQPWRYQYRHHLLVKETNRNGLAFQFAYDGMDSLAKCLRTWGDGGIYDHKLAYLPGKTIVEDSLGRKTTYHVAESGLVTRVEDPLGNASLTEYDEFNDLVKEVDELGQETVLEYDDRGNCIRLANPDGSEYAIRFEEDAAVWAKDALGGEWTWEYDAFRRPVKRVDPLGRETQYRYSGGTLDTLVDPAGQETLFRFAGNGLLETLVAPGGAETRWEYDRLGRCLAVTDARGNVQRRTWDLLARLRKLELPDGNVREIEYDPEGNPLQARDRHRTVQFRYRGMNRLAARTEQGATVEFLYDTEERLVGVRNPRGSTHAFELDAAGGIVTETGFDGQVRRFTRDAKGRATAVERAGGILSRFGFDAADRVILVAHSTGEEETYAYRADGALVAADNGVAAVAFDRDALGRVIKETQGAHSVESAFDLLGMRKGLKSSLGARQRFERNALGDVVRVEAGGGEGAPAWEARIARDILGAELERATTGGIRSRWTRDKVGRPLRHSFSTSKSFHSREYAWDADWRLKSIQDSRTGLHAFTHDPLGNLAYVEGPDGSHLFRMPDALGNLFRSPDRDDRVYGPAGQLLESRGARGITRYGYDAEGNLIRRDEPGGKTWTYQWSAAGTLSKVVRPDGTAVEFAYDALGRRVRKSHLGRVTHWVWDGNNPLHEWVEEKKLPSAAAGSPLRDAASERAQAERAAHPATAPPEEWGTADAPITWLFEPESFTPMARLRDDRAYSIIADHAGTPILMADSAGTETWSADVDAYGRRRGGTGFAGLCPFRFAGQYEDEETGLHYNRHRYYDPEAGIYVSQDPIGLAGGLAPYAFVGDPNVEIDPFGLACKSAVSGRRGRNKALHDLERNGFTVVSEEVTMVVNGKRIRADFVARDARGNIHVFEVKHGTGRLTKNQGASNVFDMNKPSNTTESLGGGTIRPGQGTKGTMTVDTDGTPGEALGGKGASHDTTFHVLHYE